MKQSIFTITENIALTDTIYRVRMEGDTSEITAPGMFVNILLDGLFLRRPISVCDVEGNILTLIYKVVGKGTEMMCKMPAGTKLDVLTGLGNGYNLKDCGDAPLLIGGGVGVPPLYLLARKLIALGKRPSVVLGFKRYVNSCLAGFFEQHLLRFILFASFFVVGVILEIILFMF